MDGATAAALLAAFERFLRRRRGARARAHGRGEAAFCAGADLKALDTLDVDAPAGPMGFTRLVVPAGRHVERALELAGQLAAFPQDTMLSDRRAVLEGGGLPLADGLALEAALGRERPAASREGAQRFAQRNS